MPLPDFHVSEPFTLGIELEMQVVNPVSYTHLTLPTICSV